MGEVVSAFAIPIYCRPTRRRCGGRSIRGGRGSILGAIAGAIPPATMAALIAVVNAGRDQSR
jgi:hypothetical protein